MLKKSRYDPNPDRDSYRNSSPDPFTVKLPLSRKKGIEMDTHTGKTTKNTEFLLNGHLFDFGDKKITGREALTKAQLTPASEFQLILVNSGRTRLVMLDDELDLKKEAGGLLRAARSDRNYSFTVEEVGQVWCEEHMSVDEFLKIWPAPDDSEWVLERTDEEDIVLRAGGNISFGPSGVEDVVSRRRPGNEKIAVAVFTTSGTYPAQGVVRVKTSVVITTMLDKAARALRLADTNNWVVTVDGKDVNASLTFEQAGFHGEVELEWGPREGGGGADA
jgi:hypothetical protein